MDLTAWMIEERTRFDGWLRGRYEAVWPASFSGPLTYPVFGGGKRVRPLLCLAAAEALEVPTEAAIAPAVAVELVHTYSLVHDDLPAMDDDDERRGRPTVHKAFDEATAILVGDALLTDAFAILAEADVDAETRIAWVRELAHAAGHLGMVGGQVADVSLGASVTDVQTLQRVHALKTGALIRAAVVMGGRAATDDLATLEKLSVYGREVGLAFQLADDVLDADEDAGDDGPPSYVRLLGVDETTRRARACADAAIAAVADLPRPEALVALARFTVERDV